jgi:hypothetical protein
VARVAQAPFLRKAAGAVSQPSEVEAARAREARDKLRRESARQVGPCIQRRKKCANRDF